MESVGADSFALSCGHRFCKDCWKGGLVASINNDMVGCVDMRCMWSKCTELVTADVFQNFLPLEAYAKYQERLLSLFVEKAPAYRTCPTAGCTKIAYFQTSGMMISGEDEKLPIVSCECNNKWCFECAEEPHSPLSCSLVRTWNSTADDNDRTQLLIKASCKNCPKCKTTISQDQGCLHMKCPKCSCHFCWLCLATPFHSNAVGGYYKCQKYENRVKDVGMNAEEKAQAMAKMRLEKYTDSYQRFVHHKSGKDAAAMLLEYVESAHTFNALSSTGVTSTEGDLTYLRDAVSEVANARRLLSWSYVHKHYEYVEDGSRDEDGMIELGGGAGEASDWKELLMEARRDRRQHEMALFENAQGMLERYCEELIALIQPPENHDEFGGGGRGVFSRRSPAPPGKGGGGADDFPEGLETFFSVSKKRGGSGGASKKGGSSGAGSMSGVVGTASEEQIKAWTSFKQTVVGRHKAIQQFSRNLTRDIREGFSDLRRTIDERWLTRQRAEMDAVEKWLEIEGLNEYGDPEGTTYDGSEDEGGGGMSDEPDFSSMLASPRGKSGAARPRAGCPITRAEQSLRHWEVGDASSPQLPEWVPRLMHITWKYQRKSSAALEAVSSASTPMKGMGAKPWTEYIVMVEEEGDEEMIAQWAWRDDAGEAVNREGGHSALLLCRSALCHALIHRIH
jgi:hypothetical protein